MVSFYAAQARERWLSKEELHVHELHVGTNDSKKPDHDNLEKFNGDSNYLDKAPCLTLYGRSVKRAVLTGVDASEPLNSATSSHYRINRALLSASTTEDVLASVEREINEFTSFHSVLAIHRLARYSRLARAEIVIKHPRWPHLIGTLERSTDSHEPRQMASIAWAFANLHVKHAPLLDVIASKCVRQTAWWDAMSLSLVPQAFAMMSAYHPELIATVSSRVQSESSQNWQPADAARVVWACARLLHRDDTLFRDVSCKMVSRLHETSPGILAQTIWSFATLATPGVRDHFFPRAVHAMKVSALNEHTAAHLAMIVWAFAAVPFRPVEFLEEVGEVVPSLGERLNSQDITMIAWSYATLLAPQRRVFEFLACTAIRKVSCFNPQDLSNTAWAFATAGEYVPSMMDAFAAEACTRPQTLNRQHVTMLLWAFITLKHRHQLLFATIGQVAHVDQNSWHSAKLLCFALAGLPKLQSNLGSDQATARVASEVVQAFLGRLRCGTSEADDAHTVHDAAVPWLHDRMQITEVDSIVEGQRQRLNALLSTNIFADILSLAWVPYEQHLVKEYQCCVQSIGIRGLGSVHTWLFIKEAGVQRASAELAQLAREAKLAQPQRPGHEHGRGERANWCFWRAGVQVTIDGVTQTAVEPGRLSNSAVVGYREECAGFVAVMMSHDHVSHRSWDCEFRAMARTAAAARAILCGQSAADAQLFMVTGAADEKVDGDQKAEDIRNRHGNEEDVEGFLEIHMTEVPCLSCICAMVQFRRRFRKIDFRVSWDAMPA